MKQNCSPCSHEHSTPRAHEHEQGHEHGSHAHDHDHSALPGAWRLGAALACAVAAELLALLGPAQPAWPGMMLAAAGIALAGLGVYREGLAALSRGRLNINALMSVAVTGAFLIGQWPEAAMVMALYALAERIEERSVERARDALAGLLALAPSQALVRQTDGSWREQPVDELAAGAVLRIQAGERVPLDGLVLSGSSSVDEASITGESLAVDKTPGDPVYGGTLNQQGCFEMRASAAADAGVLAGIVAMVTEAQAGRAPMQRLVDKLAAIYTPAVLGLALALALVGTLLLGWPWKQAVYQALVMLVIACPCALVISTPVTVVSALTAAARRGILFKGGRHLEMARRLKVVALDKTGTLTMGQPRLLAWQDVTPAMPSHAGVAAALAGRSTHPVARAIAAGLPASTQEPEALVNLPGLGLQACIQGKRYSLGSAQLISQLGLDLAPLHTLMAEQQAAGRTLSLLASDTTVLAWFAVADSLRPGAAIAVAELQALGLHTVLLSGDNQATATLIGQQAGIADARGQLLPADKLLAITALQSSHGPTAMVGDGVNDAPALARADLGLAVGALASHTAMEVADVVVMGEDLGRIASAVRLARATQRLLWQNIAIALGLKAVFMVLAAMGLASMWMAVFADMGASLLVVANGLRLLRLRS